MLGKKDKDEEEKLTREGDKDARSELKRGRWMLGAGSPGGPGPLLRCTVDRDLQRGTRDSGGHLLSGSITPAGANFPH